MKNYLVFNNNKYEVTSPNGFKCTFPKPNMWSTVQQYTIKIIVTKNQFLDLLNFHNDISYQTQTLLQNNDNSPVLTPFILKRDGCYFEGNFEFKSILTLSNTKFTNMIQLEVWDVTMNELQKDAQRDLKLAELIEI